MSTVSEPLAPSAPARTVRVTRSRRSTWWLGLAAVVLVVVLAFLPYIVFSGTTNLLVNVFILIIMASMWNLLAGYAGLVARSSSTSCSSRSPRTEPGTSSSSGWWPSRWPCLHGVACGGWSPTA